MNSFNNFIKDIRLEEHLSQVNFARKLDIPVRSYVRFEKGESKSLKIIEKVLKKYNLEIVIKKA